MNCPGNAVPAGVLNTECVISCPFWSISRNDTWVACVAPTAISAAATTAAAGHGRTVMVRASCVSGSSRAGASG
jgi:hypothetical protein